jgi:hypothetical protein
MALGLNFSSEGGGNYLGIVKFNAKAGRMFRRDRENGESIDTDITRTFKAIIDVENIEMGWMDFDTGGAPSMIMAHHLSPKPQKPSDKYRWGARVVLKLSKELGGDLREMASNSKSFLRGLDKLHDDYLEGVKKNPGKLPVVTLDESVPIVTGEGAKKSTNYAPAFEITGWTKRPDDLVYTPRNAPAQDDEEDPAPRTPPSTGSTRAAAPAKKAPESEDDWG